MLFKNLECFVAQKRVGGTVIVFPFGLSESSFLMTSLATLLSDCVDDGIRRSVTITFCPPTLDRKLQKKWSPPDKSIALA